MPEIQFLLFFPLIIAFIMLLLKHGMVRKIVIITASLAIIGVSISLAAQYYFSNESQHFIKESESIEKIIMILELLMTAFIIYMGIKYKKYFVIVLALAQSAIMLWLEFFAKTDIVPTYYIFSDKLSITMEVIIGVVGGLICIYSLGYMKDYHEKHKEYKDRRAIFYALMFVFLSAMFGLVFSANLLLIYFFWEITTLCSFLLIGYTQTKEATNNSFTALWMNMLGGLGFAIAIAYCAINFNTLDLVEIVHMGAKNALVILPVTFLAFAGLTKSAQFPFSKWLLGAMVAPTPSSALLHSATMVKAGVYLLIRLSPALGQNIAGYMVTTIGGFTFLMTSLIAITQSDAKKVLAYSTIANLGLIAACAGLGMYEAIWAAIFLIIFHAVSKSLMFLSVGAVEISTGSRDIEDMHGLIIKLPKLAFVMTVGIAGMFLAPFGMLVSKWAALKAFIDSGNMFLIFFLCFGSAATLFYWTKWLGKLVAVLHHSERLPNKVRGSQWFSLITHALLMIGLILCFPFISKAFIEPFLVDLLNVNVSEIISRGNMNIMTIMLCMIAVIPIALSLLAFNKKNKIVTAYMSGVNYGDDRGFTDSFGHRKSMYLSTWYMDDYFGEKKLFKPSVIISTAVIICMIAAAIGGILL